MIIDDKEFQKFLMELTGNLRAAGVSKDVITEAIAAAIRKRENELKKAQKVEMHTVKNPQVVYGPPPMERVEMVEMIREPQVLYGPPTVDKPTGHKK